MKWDVQKIKPPKMTQKQVAIMMALRKGNKDGSRLDVYQLIERVSPGTTRGSMISALRHLYAHGLIEDSDKVVRRGRVMRTYVCTQKGLDLIKPNLVTP